MTTPVKDQIDNLLNQLRSTWAVGDGSGFGSLFTENAHFVAFDGTVLLGAKAIAEYHQAAFDLHLKNTNLVISIDGTCNAEESALLVFTSGGIESEHGNNVLLTGASIQTMVVVLEARGAIVTAFQNTRSRPIVDEASARVWKEFDQAWNELNKSGPDYSSTF
jgi:uncharacterized protein (TIGR02246 family)